VEEDPTTSDFKELPAVVNKETNESGTRLVLLLLLARLPVLLTTKAEAKDFVDDFKILLMLLLLVVDMIFDDVMRRELVTV
jgi:hypothetical protein